MTETYEFAPCAPVRRPGRQGAGRRPETNPFENDVKAIVGKVDEDGAPLARQASFKLIAENGETLKQRSARIRRFLTRAGKELAGEGQRAYNIAMVIEESAIEGVYLVKFWDRNAGRTTAGQTEHASGQDEPNEQREPELANA
jgi:hypothetical protein